MYKQAKGLRSHMLHAVYCVRKYFKLSGLECGISLALEKFGADWSRRGQDPIRTAATVELNVNI